MVESWLEVDRCGGENGRWVGEEERMGNGKGWKDARRVDRKMDR